MAVSYKKLWKLLIDKDMVKSELRKKAGITSNALAKMSKGGDVSTAVLNKICLCLECDIKDIVEIIPENKENKGN